MMMMKGCCAVAASVLASASSLAYSSTSPPGHQPQPQPQPQPKVVGKNGPFAPKLDGLRFIETLVTAHR